MNGLLARIFRVQWSGLLAVCVLAVVALALFSPSFISEYNVFVLLRSICVAVGGL